MTPVQDLEHRSLSASKAISKALPTAAQSDLEGTWFIGAFGKWWVGGSVHVSGLEVIDMSSQEEVRAGVVSMRSLDRCPVTEGMHFVHILYYHGLTLVTL